MKLEKKKFKIWRQDDFHLFLDFSFLDQIPLFYSRNMFKLSMFLGSLRVEPEVLSVPVASKLP